MVSTDKMTEALPLNQKFLEEAYAIVYQTDSRWRSQAIGETSHHGEYPEKFLFRTKEAQFEAVIWILSELVRDYQADEVMKRGLASCCSWMLCQYCLRKKDWAQKQAALKDGIIKRLSMYVSLKDLQDFYLTQLAYVSSIWGMENVLTPGPNQKAETTVFRDVTEEDALLSKTLQKEGRLLQQHIAKWQEKVRSSAELNRLQQIALKVGRILGAE